MTNAFHWQGVPSIFSGERMKSIHQHRVHAVQQNYHGSLGAHTRSASNREISSYAIAKKRSILEFIRDNPNCTFTEIRTGVNIPKTSVADVIKELMAEGIVSKTVSGRNKLYEVIA